MDIFLEIVIPYIYIFFLQYFLKFSIYKCIFLNVYLIIFKYTKVSTILITDW